MNHNINPDIGVDDTTLISFEKYRHLRNLIFKHLLTIYDRLDYRDADGRSYEILICGSKGNHTCMSVFNVIEWLGFFESGTFPFQMVRHLTWCLHRQRKYNLC
ncbi:hypothetical protein PBAL39_21570 [Pedobacter sp. BAL39]|uniref:hypothetical protein n=1 Tax=Pedobacter sp. BAL39 TaxID=391596 RepID=UPI0001559D81|nr:hypothetical protein [Pedobacter sp. BAL39]EDM38705.1 hypothetical protein PBAL39_21570 [Pedobacter sp. BAL39]